MMGVRGCCLPRLGRGGSAATCARPGKDNVIRQAKAKRSEGVLLKRDVVSKTPRLHTVRYQRAGERVRPVRAVTLLDCGGDAGLVGGKARAVGTFGG